MRANLTASGRKALWFPRRGRSAFGALLAICCFTAAFCGAQTVSLSESVRGAAGVWALCSREGSKMADDDGLTLNFASSGGSGAGGALRKVPPGMSGAEARRLARMPRKGKPKLGKKKKKDSEKVAGAAPMPASRKPTPVQPLRGGGEDNEGPSSKGRGGRVGGSGRGGSVRASDMMNRPWERRPKEEDVRQAEPMRPQEVTASIKGKGLVAAKRKQARSPPVCAHSPATSCRPLCPPPPSALRGALTRRGAAQTAAANCSDDATFSFSAFSDPGLELHPHLVPPLPPAPAPPFARCHASASARRVTGARAAPQVASLKERFGASRLTRIQQVRVLAHLPRDAVCPISTG